MLSENSIYIYIYIYVYIYSCGGCASKKLLCHQEILNHMLALGSSMILEPKLHYHKPREFFLQYHQILLVFCHVVGMLDYNAASLYNPFWYARLSSQCKRAKLRSINSIMKDLN